MSRAFVVVNPAAGGGRTARAWRTLQDELARLGLDFEWAATAGPGGATELARRAAADGWPLVIAVGGDGTLNEVVNGLVDAGGRPRAALGVIGTGRGRDACANLGLPADPMLAARRLLTGADVALDLGVAEWPDGTRRCFVNACGAGFDAVVARRVAARGGSGTVPYVRGVLEALRAQRPLAVDLVLDGAQTWRGPVTAVVVANGARYGGGMRIAPAADPTDACLDLVVLGALGRLELVWWLPTVYRGEHLGHRKIFTRRAREVVIRAATPLPTHVDGEAAPPTPVTLRVLPGALRLRR
ncbi:MAG: hypothetical protein A3D33_13255 [Candidatus Rokubacteria bacterium RIFCSPHIGHO2_02_FULL_73_26]|nr:MAG: hypothetical protein A3D33_13255 [Candidatus Rokubacteria bacterium RIFCSPHIGHO2_02_FULL_73_26]